MALFNKNQNESAYTGGKKHWADAIKNSGPGDLLIWRQPEEDFNTNSTLIVMPGEEAIFIKGGVIEQVFDNGTYKLSTENYPFISRLRNAFTGGISTFNCVVYFVRKAHSREILWGTATPIQLRDPVLKIQTSIRSRGAYKIRIDDGTKFLTKLVGNNVVLFSQDEIMSNFDNQFQMHIKSLIAKFIKNSDSEVLGICSEMYEFAQAITPFISAIFEDYGVKLVEFSISGLDIPENDPNRQKLENYYAEKGGITILAEDWGRIQAKVLLELVAQNPGAGGVAAAGAGIGMGMASGNVFAGLAQQMFTPMQQQVPQQNTSPQPSGRFTQKAAPSQAVQSSEDNDPVATLKKLKEMLEHGLIEQAEYDAKKAEIMSRM